MKWSWKIGRISGIDVYMHLTFLILLAWVGLSHYFQARRVSDAIDGLVFILVLFFIVVLHELGHALAARRFDISTRDIILLPIGGVARLERMPEKPQQELVVALAGPAVNVVLAGILLAFLVPLSAVSKVGETQVVGGDFLTKLFWVNIGLAVFNMIPAFPMDGGRALRALLATRLNYVRATEIAAGVGQALALLFGFVGLFFNPFLVFIALFVWMGASQEAGMVSTKSLLHGVPIHNLMITQFETIDANHRLQYVVDRILAGMQQDFPVVEDGKLAGILTRNKLMTSLASEGATARVGDVMETSFQTAEPNELAQTAFERLQSCQCHTLPVLSGSKIVGLITTENLGEFLMIQEALSHRQ